MAFLLYEPIYDKKGYYEWKIPFHTNHMHKAFHLYGLVNLLLEGNDFSQKFTWMLFTVIFLFLTTSILHINLSLWYTWNIIFKSKSKIGSECCDILLQINFIVLIEPNFYVILSKVKDRDLIFIRKRDRIKSVMFMILLNEHVEKSLILNIITF